MKSPEEIVNLMYEKDTFSQWLGIEILSVGLGFCELRSTVNELMLNGHHTLHGGITYSLSDSALAFASNSRGERCVSIETSISHIRKCQAGDILTVKATEAHRGKTIGIYDMVVTNQEGRKVALFKGTVHISNEIW
jgi:acyl-CoA thioesterase